MASYVVELEIAPKRKPETYTREVQCEIIDTRKLGKIAEEDEDDEDGFENRFNHIAETIKPRRDSQAVKTGISEVRRDSAAPSYLGKDEKVEVKDMPKDEAKRVMATSEFQAFLVESSRYVERALGSEFDLRGDFFSYDSDEEAAGGDTERSKGGRLMKKFAFEEQNDYRRAVTSLDWSPSTPELLLASFSKCNEWSMDEPDGFIAIYSIAMQTRPELTLNCQYEVTKAIFNPFDSNIVIGAT